MAATDRAFRALGRDEPATLLGLVQVLAPTLWPPGHTPGALVDRDSRLDIPDPSLEVDAVFSDAASGVLWHLEGQGYHDPEFLERVLRYHLGLALRHWARQVRTIALWLRRPTPEERQEQLHHGDVSVRVTHLVLAEASARQLVADERTACFSPGGHDEGRGDALVCQQAVAVLQASGASLRRWQMAAVAARSQSAARYHAMVRAMQQAGVRAVLIEDLIQIGQEEGFERGLEKGLERGLEKGQARTLTRQIERKLGRALGEGERQAVDRRLATLGADQVGDAVLDLDRDALAAWLVAAG
jgi:hypothetical protein